MTSSEKIQSAIAIFVAFLALFISVWQGCEQRNHNRLSVKPLLTFDEVTIDKQREIKLSNSGLGPAIIEDFIIRDSSGDYSSSNKNLSFMPLMNARGLIDSVSWNYYFYTGDVIRAGEDFTILRWKIKNSENLNIKIEVKYKSIYNESFEVVTEF